MPALQLLRMPWARNVYWVYGLVLGEERETDAVRVCLTCDSRHRDAAVFFSMQNSRVSADGLFLMSATRCQKRLARQGFTFQNGLTISTAQIAEVRTRQGVPGMSVFKRICPLL